MIGTGYSKKRYEYLKDLVVNLQLLVLGWVVAEVLEADALAGDGAKISHEFVDLHYEILLFVQFQNLVVDFCLSFVYLRKDEFVKVRDFRSSGKRVVVKSDSPYPENV